MIVLVGCDVDNDDDGFGRYIMLILMEILSTKKNAIKVTNAFRRSTQSDYLGAYSQKPFDN